MLFIVPLRSTELTVEGLWPNVKPELDRAVWRKFQFTLSIYLFSCLINNYFQQSNITYLQLENGFSDCHGLREGNLKASQ